MINKKPFILDTKITINNIGPLRKEKIMTLSYKFFVQVSSVADNKLKFNLVK